MEVGKAFSTCGPESAIPPQTEPEIQQVIDNAIQAALKQEVKPNQPSLASMTLLDWFAGMALQGMLGNPEWSGSWEGYAEDAYGAAAAMLCERNKANG